MCTSDFTMKTCLCLLALAVVVVYVKGESCPSGHATDCRLTICTGGEWVLGCVDNVCTCAHTEGGSHACTSNADCGGGRHCERNQQWRCIQGTCHCTHAN